jgi:hypothetical protein
MRLGGVRRGGATIAIGWLSITCCGCGTAPPPAPHSTRELIMAYDDGRATGTVAFPTPTYENMLRFALPEGEHRLLRLRFEAGAEGQLEITIYDSTVLETPGEPLRRLTFDVAKDDLSDGKDGRWLVHDLIDMKPLKGIVWVGVRKTGGTPTIWASSVISGQAFIRNNDPQNPMGLLPTKRTPMLRLEVAP